MNAGNGSTFSVHEESQAQLHYSTRSLSIISYSAAQYSQHFNPRSRLSMVFCSPQCRTQHLLLPSAIFLPPGHTYGWRWTHFLHQRVSPGILHSYIPYVSHTFVFFLSPSFSNFSNQNFFLLQAWTWTIVICCAVMNILIGNFSRSSADISTKHGPNYSACLCLNKFTKNKPTLMPNSSSARWDLECSIYMILN